MLKALRFLLPTTALTFALALSPITANAAHDLAATAERAEKTAEKFKDRLDSELDKLTIDGFDDEERMEELSEQLRARLDELRDEVKEGEDSDARKELEEALEVARPINDAMGAYAFSPALKEMWSQLSSDLNKMASDLNLPTLVVIVTR